MKIKKKNKFKFKDNKRRQIDRNKQASNQPSKQKSKIKAHKETFIYYYYCNFQNLEFFQIINSNFFKKNHSLKQTFNSQFANILKYIIIYRQRERQKRFLVIPPKE
ncbi:hypothetical protein ABPG72_013970 [Tetrahymena utriculariae]